MRGFPVNKSFTRVKLALRYTASLKAICFLSPVSFAGIQKAVSAGQKFVHARSGNEYIRHFDAEPSLIVDIIEFGLRGTKVADQCESLVQYA